MSLTPDALTFFIALMTWVSSSIVYVSGNLAVGRIAHVKGVHPFYLSRFAVRFRQCRFSYYSFFVKLVLMLVLVGFTGLGLRNSMDVNTSS